MPFLSPLFKICIPCLFLQAADLEADIFNNDDELLPNMGREAEFMPTTRFEGLRQLPGDDDQSGGGGLLDVYQDRAPAAAGKQAAWQDSDDEDVEVTVAAKSMLRKLREDEDEVVLRGKEYEKRLRSQHNKLNPRATWASKSADKKKDKSSAASEQAGKLLASAGGLLSRASRLPSGRLETTRLKDANQEEPSEAVVRSVEFHSGGQLLMAASLDRHLRFFSIDGVDNPRVQSIFLEDMPVHQAAFTGGGAQVIATGRRSFFYVLDLETAKIERVNGIFGQKEKSFESFAASPSSQTAAFFGRDGTVPLVSLSSRQAVGSLKMNGTVRAGAFSADGQELLTTGSDGMIYLWDLRMQKCVEKYVDEGSIGGTALAASPDGKTFASGATSGIVNVYQYPAASITAIGGNNGGVTVPQAPIYLNPMKALPQLTTAADSLTFSPDGQVLAIASRLKKDSLRLIHVPTLSAFTNWPTSRTPLHYVHSMCFSPGGGYLAIGNAKGRVVLYRLHHYPQA
jgi:U3 small nucleolar RNA-associated protein 18